MNKDALIRKATEKDLKELLELTLKSTLYHHDLDKKFIKPHKLKRGSYKELKKNELKTLKEDLKNPKNKIFIAIIEDKIIGFINISFPKKNANIKSKRGEIDDFFILEDYRKKGIGKILFKKTLTLFKSKGIKLISLNVNSNNFATLKFYEKIGFKENLKRLCLYVK
jgi:ribosomal protein S18 acetylase RimI-like enzyme